MDADDFGCELCGEEDAEFEVNDSDPYTGYTSYIRIGRRCEAARRGIILDEEDPPFMSSPDNCEFCGALWNVDSLSVPRPECTCGLRICWKCQSMECPACRRRIHMKCRVGLGEEDYCEDCAALKIRKQLVEDLTLEELLAASAAIAKNRKDAG